MKFSLCLFVVMNDYQYAVYSMILTPLQLFSAGKFTNDPPLRSA